MIYFDNSATTLFKPESVVNAMTCSMLRLGGNPGRSGHEVALKCGRLVHYARERCSAFFGANGGENIIFTPSCSFALNLAISSLVMRGKHVVTTALEHNSVLRPLHALQKMRNIDITTVIPTRDGIITPELIENALKRDTCLVIINHISNVTGAIADVSRIGRICRSRGIKLLVDGAQSVGYCDIDMNEMCIDALAVAPHKGLHAAQGVGILATCGNIELSPILYGGTGTDSYSLKQPIDIPDGFEVGTLPTPAISTLIPAIEWSEKNKVKNREKLLFLSTMIREGLKDVRTIVVYSPQNAASGIFTFNINGYTSESVGDILSGEYGICVRTGLHCAPFAHKYLGTETRGAVRVSLGCDNTEEEVRFFIRAIKEIAPKI